MLLGFSASLHFKSTPTVISRTVELELWLKDTFVLCFMSTAELESWSFCLISKSSLSAGYKQIYLGVRGRAVKSICARL